MNRKLKLFLQTILIITLFTITAIKSYDNYEFAELNKYTKDDTVEQIIEYEMLKNLPKTCSDMPKGVNLMIVHKFKDGDIHEIVECTRQGDTIKEHLCGSSSPKNRQHYIECPSIKREPVPQIVRDYAKKHNIKCHRYIRTWKNYKAYLCTESVDYNPKIFYILYDGKTIRQATDKERYLIWFMDIHDYY